MKVGHKKTCSGFRWLSRLSDVLPPLRSWVRALYRRTSDRTWEEFVNTLPKFVGFVNVVVIVNVVYVVYTPTPQLLPLEITPPSLYKTLRAPWRGEIIARR